MKRFILTLILIGLPMFAYASYTGWELYEQLIPPYNMVPWADGHAKGYIDGVIDAALGCPHGQHLTAGQAWQMVQNYLEAHPEEWNKSAPILIKEALNPVCKY